MDKKLALGWLRPQMYHSSDQNSVTSNDTIERASSGDGSHEPAYFMPSSPSALMLVSSGSFRHEYSNDRAIATWAEGSKGLLSANHGDKDGTRVYESENVEHDETATSSTSSTVTSASTTPPTPPTPPTPTTPSSITSFFAGLTEKATNYRTQTYASTSIVSQKAPGMRWVLLCLILVLACSTLLALSIFGYESVSSKTSEILLSLVWEIKAISDGLEIFLEGAGFVVGRAMARFGKGFERGYN